MKTTVELDNEDYRVLRKGMFPRNLFLYRKTYDDMGGTHLHLMGEYSRMIDVRIMVGLEQQWQGSEVI